MANYHNPVTIARESGAYIFQERFRGLRWWSDLTVGHFNSGACEALARRGWYIYVSLSALPR
jgi:hypothetical protein